MECPHCHQSLPFLTCSACGKEMPAESRYCNQCGVQTERITQEKAEEKDDFLDRKLCSDGTCIGIINEKGVCNICGKSYAG